MREVEQETQVQSLGREDPLEGHGNPFEYSCQENLMDRGTWQATVHGIIKSRAQLIDKHAQSIKETSFGRTDF